VVRSGQARSGQAWRVMDFFSPCKGHCQMASCGVSGRCKAGHGVVWTLLPVGWPSRGMMRWGKVWFRKARSG